MIEPPKFGSRLDRAAELAGFTVADLSEWFDRNYATVRYWIFGNGEYPAGNGPRSGRKDALKRLSLLEWAVENAEPKIFPISHRLARGTRQAWVRKLYAEFVKLHVWAESNRLSKTHPAEPGVQD